jgi:hypothetical protein
VNNVFFISNKLLKENSKFSKNVIFFKENCQKPFKLNYGLNYGSLKYGSYAIDARKSWRIYDVSIGQKRSGDLNGIFEEK